MGAMKEYAMCNQIRSRKSYKLFKEWNDFLKGKPKRAEILRKLDRVIDDKKGYGSRMHACYAQESLTQVIIDN